jgi:hypothetical protein
MLLFLGELNPVNASNVDPSKFKRGLAVVTFGTCVGEAVETVARDEKLEAVSCGFNGLEAVGLVELPAELPDDALNDVWQRMCDGSHCTTSGTPVAAGHRGRCAERCGNRSVSWCRTSHILDTVFFSIRPPMLW